MLTLFETSSQPEYSDVRLVSSLRRLDSVVSSFRLTCIDAGDDEASVFLPYSVPSIPRKTAMLQPPPRIIDAAEINSSVQIFKHDLDNVPEVDSNPPIVLPDLPRSGIVEITPTSAPLSGSELATSSDSETVVSCLCAFALPRHRHISPGTPSWDPNWSVSQMQQEEIRRICWSSLKFGCLHLGLDDQQEQGGYLGGLTYLQPARVNICAIAPPVSLTYELKITLFQNLVRPVFPGRDDSPLL